MLHQPACFSNHSNSSQFPPCLFFFFPFSSFCCLFLFPRNWVTTVRIKASILMASYEQEGRPLPKFGEWDVNDPASAEGFTVIFNKARDDKKTGAGSVRVQSQRRNNSRKEEDKSAKAQKKWFCFKP